MIRALDLERVEILRGPQGTLFGRNSIAGVINVTRMKPTIGDVSGGVRLGLGNNGDQQVDGYLSVPIGDKFAAKLGGAYRANDGYFFNRTRNMDVGETEFKSFSPSFAWQVTEDLEITYRFDKTWQDPDSTRC